MISLASYSRRSKFNMFLVYVFFSYMILDQKLITLVLNLEKSIDIAYISAFEIILQIITIVLELPTGILGDNYSKKKILIGSRISCILYCLILLISNCVIVIAIAFAALGLGEALTSGTEDSFISELNDKDNDLLKKYMFYSTTNQVATVVAVLVGGILFNLNWKLMYIFMIFNQIISIVFLCGIKSENKNKNKFDLKCYSVQIKNLGVNNKWLKIGAWGSLFASIYSVYTIYLPLYLSRRGISSFRISIISCIQISLGFFLMTIVGKFINQKYSKNVCIISSVVFTFGLLLMPISTFMSLSIGSIISSSFGIVFFPAITTMINEDLNDEIRAIGNSLVNLFQAILMCIVIAIIGYIS